MATSGRMVGASRTIANARAVTYWQKGMCLNFVEMMATNRRGLGVYAPSAWHAWQHAKHRHTRGTPPRGAFVFWSTSRHPYGHVAISEGNGYVRHDWGGRSVRTTISTVNRAGYRYAGWSEDLYGQRNIGPFSSSTNAYPGHVHSRRHNHTHSSHVKKIQRKVGATADGVFGRGTESKVKAWQRAHHLTADGIVGPATWRKMF